MIELEDLKDLTPGPIWHYFEAISRIPRCSGNEEALVAYIQSESERLGWKCRRDGAGNVIVDVAARGTGVGKEVLVLQSHLDMVCEKNRDSDHDFQKDPIRFKRDGDLLRARSTSLGADNGIGVATMLAIGSGLSPDHPPLELLFTIDEERGLTGAMNLTPESFRGRRLLNLDSEEEGAFYVGCAGGGDISLDFPVEKTSVPTGQWEALDVLLSGLWGGHSGMDISKGRGNGIQIMARLLRESMEMDRELLVRFQGGDKKNAIPREAEVTVLTGDGEGFRRRMESSFQNIARELSHTEAGIQLKMSPGKKEDVSFSRRSTETLLNLILTIPHGPLVYSKKIHGQVVTSNNLASLRPDPAGVVLQCHARSTMESAMESVRSRVEAAGELAGAVVRKEGAYPGWEPDLDSNLLSAARDAYREHAGKDPKITTIHAGLETGVIQSRVGKMDLLSIGPEIQAPHSPDENVSIPSVERFVHFLTYLLKKL